MSEGSPVHKADPDTWKEHFCVELVVCISDLDSLLLEERKKKAIQSFDHLQFVNIEVSREELHTCILMLVISETLQQLHFF